MNAKFKPDTKPDFHQKLQIPISNISNKICVLQPVCWKKIGPSQGDGDTETNLTGKGRKETDGEMDRCTDRTVID